MKKSLLCFLITGAMAMNVAYAEDSSHTEHVEHIGPHVHGEANINLAIDGEQLVIALESPAMNILGFEHEPNTDEQKEVVENAERTLHHIDDLFVINNGQCSIKEMDIDMPFEDHDHEHEHEEHEHEHAHTHADGSVHSDIDASYTYHCEQPQNINQVTFNIFNEFPGFHEIHVQWINGSQQGAQEVDKNNNVIKLN